MLSSLMYSNPAGPLFQQSSLRILTSLTLHSPFISSPIPIDKSTLGLSTWNSINYNILICQSLTKPILSALFLPYSHYAYSTSFFLSTCQLFNAPFSPHYLHSWLHFFLKQTRHKMHHFHHCLSASPIPKFRWTELSAVSYFYPSVDCPFLPLYIQGLQLTSFLGSSVL